MVHTEVLGASATTVHGDSVGAWFRSTEADVERKKNVRLE